MNIDSSKMNRRTFLTCLGGFLLSLPFVKNGFSDTLEGASPVYFTKNISSAGMGNILDHIKGKLSGKVGIKLHFGEAGNKNFISPDLVKPLAKDLNAALVETNVLYVSKRRYTESHIQVAKDHGFGFAPIDILDADGDLVLPADTKHFKEVRTGKNFSNYDSFLVLSHFKGHMLTGFGGAIKNMGMGFASVSGKMALHASTVPMTSPDKCIKCGQCVKECPGNAITIDPLVIDPKKCIGCGRCIGVCPVHAFNVPWGSTEGAVVMERLCDYTKVLTAEKPMVYINVLANISKDCDCDHNAHPPFMDDIGILASDDIVALEKACLDLVNDRYGSSDTFKEINHVSGNHQIEYAESIGLGSSNYSLLSID